MAKLVQQPSKGFFQITEKGKKILSKGTFTLKDLKEDNDYIAHEQARKEKKENEVEEISVDNASPQDLIDSGFSTIETQVKTDLLEKLRDIDPYYFEKVILILLKKMGYGDFVETAKSGDGGID
jgi:restriction system protein